MIKWKSIKTFGIDSLIIFAMATVGKMIVKFVLALLAFVLVTIVALAGG